MKKTTDSSTLHNSFVSSSQENLQENTLENANSMPTQAPTEGHKSVISRKLQSNIKPKGRQIYCAKYPEQKNYYGHEYNIDYI